MATTIQQIELPKKARALDTSGNNNHGQIYSGRGLEFDGVSDHLSLTQTDISTGAWTVAAWIYTGGILDGTADAIMHGGSGNRSANYISVRSSNKVTIYDHASGAFRDANTVLNDNTWYRVLWVYDGAGEITFYVNGVADGTGVIATSGINDDLVVQYIGTFNAASRWWNGMLSDFQAWDAAFTQADVTYDYLNPESLALNNGGTALTESNLKLWYPMQDGHRGQQSYILDGANSGLSDIYASNFSSGVDGWTAFGLGDVAGGISIGGEDDSLRYTVTTAIGDTRAFKKTSTLTVGLQYKVTFSYYIPSTNPNLNAVFLQGSNIRNSVLDTWTTVTEYFTAAFVDAKIYVGDANDYLNPAATGETAYIKDVSIKAINDKNHATTVFYGDNLLAGVSGAADGDFEDSGNTPAFAATYSSGSSGITYDTDNTSSPLTGSKDGKVTNAAGVNAGIISDAITLVTGRTYKVGFNYLTNYNASSQTNKLRFKIGEIQDHDSTNIDSTGGYAPDNNLAATSKTAYSQTFVHTDSDTEVFIVLFGGDGLVFQIDDVYFKEVGVASGWTDADQQLHIPQTALQSYNELAWFDGVADYVQLADPYSHNTITVSAWVYISQDTTAHKCVFSNRDSGDDGLLLTVNGDEKVYAKFNGAAVISNTVLSIGDWHHIVYTYDDTTMKVYINGVLDNSGTFTASNMDVTANANIGKGTQAGYYFPGSITEVSTWASALSLAEIQELYNDGKALDATIHSKAITATTNLKGYFRNNGLSTWTDLSNDYSNNGTPTSITETILIPQGVDSTRDAQGFIMNKQKDTSCLNLDGIGYVSLPTTSVVTDDFSFEAWAKAEYVTGGESVIMEVGASMLLFGGDHAYIRAVDGTFTNQLPTHSFVLGNWYHIVVTRIRNGNQIMYVDGVAKNTVTAPDTAMTLSDTTIGKDNTTRVSRDALDGVHLYSKALSAGEVLRNYNATKGNHRN